MKLLETDFRGEPVVLTLGHYSNGRVALQLLDADESLVLTITVNLENEDCGENEIWVKVTDENEDIDEWLTDKNLIESDGMENSISPAYGAIRYRMTQYLLQVILERMVECGQRSRR